MLYPDIIELKQFYGSRLGAAVVRAIARGMRKLWPIMPRESILAIGYPTPYLEGCSAQSKALAIVMPARQGAAYWPMGGDNCAVLAQEAELPFVDGIFNRVLLVHSLEQTEHASRLMQETWRLLTPGGRVLMAVPNRLSLWSRVARTPFGYGRPFSLPQIRALLAAHSFTYVRSTSVLFMPPLDFKWLHKISLWLDRIGGLLFPMFGGILLVEAEKQIYAGVREPVATAKAYRMPGVATQPAMSSRNSS